MKPIEQSKGESQFYFSDNTVKTLSNILSDLGITGILCVGCPRLHEHIVNSQLHCNVRSMLLDIDPRYVSKITYEFGVKVAPDLSDVIRSLVNNQFTSVAVLRFGSVSNVQHVQLPSF